MFFVFLLALAHLASAWILTTRLLKPTRLCDVLLLVSLVVMTTFYGLPIIFGLVTRHLNSITVVVPAMILASAAFAVYKREKSSLSYGRILTRRIASLAWHEIVLILVVMCIAVGLFLIGAQLPVRIWDASGYHIIGPVRWVQSGRFTLDSFGDPFVFPYLGAAQSYANVKGILPFLIMLWSGSTAGTALAQWPYLCVLILALYALYRRLQLPPSVAMVGILVCVTAPEVILQSVEAYADVAYFAGIACVLWACLQTWQDRLSARAILHAAMSFALLMGTKPTAGVSCAFLGLAYLIICLMRAEKSVSPVRRLYWVASAFSVIVILSVAIAGYWYINALINLKNPVYPMNVSILGTTIFPGPYPPTMNDDAILTYSGGAGFKAWWYMMSERWRPPSIASWSAGLGSCMFIIGMPCIIVSLFVVWFQKKKIDILVVLLLFGGLLLVSPSLPLARFSLFTLALAGLAIGRVAVFFPTPVQVSILLIAMALSFQNIYATMPSILYRPRPTDLVTFDLVSGYPRTAKNDSFPEDYTVIDYWLDKVAAPDTLVAIVDEIGVWTAFEPTPRPNIVRIIEDKAESFPQWLARVRSAGATHTIILRSSPYFRQAMGAKSDMKLLYWDVAGRVQRSQFMPPLMEGALFELSGSAI